MKKRLKKVPNSNFDIKKIQNNFSKASKDYSNFAQTQKIAARNLTLLASPFLQNNQKILDLGSGNGFLAENIAKYQKNCQIFEFDLSYKMLQNRLNKNDFAIQGDINQLCFKENSFDLIISSFSLQWLNDFDKIFQDCYNILKPKGIFTFCLPNKESLKEIKDASLKSNCNFNLNELPKTENLQKEIEKSPFNFLNIYQEAIKQEFNSGIDALKSIKKTGASYSRGLNFISKNKLKEFDKFCLKDFNSDNNKVQVSWIVDYFILTK